MDKIASPNELQAELRRLLSYAESKQPSRAKLAAGLSTLANNLTFVPKLLDSDIHTQDNQDFPGSYFAVKWLDRLEGETLAKAVKVKSGFDVYWEVDRDNSGTVQVAPRDIDAPWSRWTRSDHMRTQRQVERLLQRG